MAIIFADLSAQNCMGVGSGWSSLGGNNAVCGKFFARGGLQHKIGAPLLIHIDTNRLWSNDTSALLELRSTTKGLLIPRMSSAQMSAIVSPASGLQIYNTSTNEINWFNGSTWNAITGGAFALTDGNGTTANGTSCDLGGVLSTLTGLQSRSGAPLIVANDLLAPDRLISFGDASLLGYADTSWRILGLVDKAEITSFSTGAYESTDTNQRRVWGLFNAQSGTERFANIYDAYKIGGSVVDHSRWECHSYTNNESRSYIRGTIFQDSTNARGSGFMARGNFAQIEVLQTNQSSGNSDTASGTFLRVDTTNGVTVYHNGTTVFNVGKTGTIEVHDNSTSATDVTTANNRLSFDDCNTGWATYIDSTYTSGSPLVFTASTWTTIPFSPTDIIDTYLPCDIDSFYDRTDSTFLGKLGDAYTINVSFKVRPNTPTTTLLDFGIDIGGNIGVVYPKTLLLTKGDNIEQYFISSFTVYTLGTWVSNGGKAKIKTDHSVDIYDVRYEVFRVHKN